MVFRCCGGRKCLKIAKGENLLHSGPEAQTQKRKYKKYTQGQAFFVGHVTFAVVLWHFRCRLGSLGVSGLSTSHTLAQATQPGLIDHSPLDDLPDGSFTALLLPASRLPHRAAGLRILDIPPRWGYPRSSVPCFGIRFQLLILVFPTQEPRPE